MYYFIPAWYGKERPWHADLTPWYFSHFKLEFDDTFNQIRLMQRQGIPAQVLLLSYQPHLRYFLHRQGILEAQVDSLFDELQDFHEIRPQVLQVRDIEWEEDCEFVYSPFTILVLRNGKPYAQVEHGIEGFISTIQYFKENGLLSANYLMDDRGLVSSVIYYEDGQAIYQDYLNPKGLWQFREHLHDGGRIEVNPIFAFRFQKETYRDMGELIAEFFEKRLAQLPEEEAVYFLPACDHHNAFLVDRLPRQTTKVLSLFIGRNPQEQLPQLVDLLPKVDLVLVDREDTLCLAQSDFPEQAEKFHHLSPFDTRLELGKSQTRKESLLYYQLDFEQGIDDQALYQVLHFLSENKDTELVFGAFATDQEEMKHLETRVAEMVAERFKNQELEKEVDYQGAENPLEDNLHQAMRYSFVNMKDESELIKQLEFVRLIVDLNSQPLLYTQIAGISAGIPQINRVKTEYVSHKKNGYLLENIADFAQAAHYYLDSLQVWNDSLIHSIEKIKEHTGEQFLIKLEKWLEEVTHGKEI